MPIADPKDVKDLNATKVLSTVKYRVAPESVPYSFDKGIGW